MKTIENIFHWGDAHHPKWMVLLRVLLGAVLFYKGVQYGQDAAEIRALTENTFLGLWSQFIIHYIVMIHLAGGFFIVIGLATRLFATLQIPIVLGAMILWGESSGLMDIFSQFGFALTVLLLLFLFLLIGSGPLSADEYLKKHTAPYPMKGRFSQ